MSLPQVSTLLREFSAAEKRYAAAMAKRLLSKEQSRVIQLFDCLQKASGETEEEQEALLRKQFNRKTLPADLNYLYRFLLKVLRSYHEESTVNIRIRAHLVNAELLLQKRLYDQSFRELERARRLASHHERHHELLQILHLKTSILLEHQPKELFEKLETLTAEAQEALEALNLNSQLFFIERRTFAHVRSRYQLRGESRQKFLDEIASDKLLLHPPAPSQRAARLRYLNIQASVAICQGDFAGTSNIYDEMLAIWESDRERLKEDVIEYKKLLSNKLTALHAGSAFEQMPFVIKKIEALPCSSAEEEAEQFQNTSFMELLYRMNTDRLDDIDTFFTKVNAGIRKYRTKINQARLQLFYYNISVCCFSLHRWKDALTWLTPIIEQPKTDHRIDIQNFARLFRLVLYYELGKHDILEYELINAERYLKLRKAWFAYEASITKLIRKLLESQKEERIALLGKFLARLDEVGNGQNSASLPGITELKLWANHHRTQKTIRELLMEENKAALEGKPA